MSISHLPHVDFETMRKAVRAQGTAFLSEQRWFGSKARQIKSVDLSDMASLPSNGISALFLIFDLAYADGGTERYSVPVTWKPSRTSGTHGASIVIENSPTTVVWTDALADSAFEAALPAMIREEVSIQTRGGRFFGKTTPHLSTTALEALPPHLSGAEQSNSSVIYGDQLILKFFRRVQSGINPDLEIGSFLTNKAHFKNIPPLLGSLEYQAGESAASTQAILQGFVRNRGDAWKLTLSVLADFYDGLLTDPPPWAEASGGEADLSIDLFKLNLAAQEALLNYSYIASLVGRRTAELHLALSSDPNDPAFAPEPVTRGFQESTVSAVILSTKQVFELLRQKAKTLAPELRSKTEELLDRENEIETRSRAALPSEDSPGGMRTRIHGDYHLGQLLYTGSDFVIVDFEGEPAQPLEQRRVKRSPLQDVAGMLRSFHYAAFAALFARSSATPSPSTKKWLDVAARAWARWTSERFLASYLRTAQGAAFLPPHKSQLRAVLRLHLLEKAIYELNYELNNRPDWVLIPLEGIRDLLSMV
jgi:trehalose synthase-fused probable maltokinase